MQIVEVPLFELPPPVRATTHVGNMPTFLGKPYPIHHADLGYLVPVDPASLVDCDSCQ